MNKILVVDDEVSFTNMVKLILERTGEFEVRVENKGTNTLSAAREFKPDLVLLDIVMPDISGSEAASQLKDAKDVKDIPIVFLTAVVTGEEVTSKRGLIGGQVFMAKPIGADELIDCIKKNIRKA